MLFSQSFHAPQRRPVLLASWGFVLVLMAQLSFAQKSQPLNLILKEEALPGVVWATIDESEVITGGSGYAELSSKKPMTADSKVQVGSVTKTLVAVAVLHLVAEKRVSLDSDLEQILPSLNWDNPWRDETPITLRHLLEHTAGLDNLRMWQFLNSAVSPDTPLEAAFPQDQDRLLRLRTRPGSQYSYSNMGYALLGLVIEKLTQERYEDYLNRELLQPLDMHDSSFSFITQDQDSRLAMGYLEAGVEQQSVPMFLRPAGQFTTTAADMQSLLGFLLGDGSLNGEPFIEAQHMESLGRPSTTDAYKAGLSMGHGLALARRDRHGVIAECHPGETFGFRAQLCLFPSEEKAFFYAVNADDENADYERFTQYFISALDVEPPPPTPVTPNAALEPYVGLYKLAPNNMAEFAWLDWVFNSVWLSVDQGRQGLVMHSLQGQERLLLPLGGGLFRDAERSVASHIFFGDEQTTLSYGLTTWKKASPVSLLLAWLSLAAGILGLLYIVLRGTWLSRPGTAMADNALLLPWICVLSFALPVYLYAGQPFLQFGELTAASALLAVISGLLPFSLAFAAYRLLRRSKPFLPDLFAVLSGLQLCLVLVFEGVLPLIFWR
ncbi:Beta-lactamase class C and other penicillin binding protein [Congregibacter litoralis KT71]|uniref:Beta-lactamase class C and other penicillin binding protein n=2 Tax=Congregibacter TaxID=393661 RepID=A4A989_9GAMM|nr:Beta-lactamase class C and other penicillin binding protein [Congregibacter litoralis KT71]